MYGAWRGWGAGALGESMKGGAGNFGGDDSMRSSPTPSDGDASNLQKSGTSFIASMIRKNSDIHVQSRNSEPLSVTPTATNSHLGASNVPQYDKMPDGFAESCTSLKIPDISLREAMVNQIQDDVQKGFQDVEEVSTPPTTAPTTPRIASTPPQSQRQIKKKKSTTKRATSVPTRSGKVRQESPIGREHSSRRSKMSLTIGSTRSFGKQSSAPKSPRRNVPFNTNVNVLKGRSPRIATPPRGRSPRFGSERSFGTPTNFNPPGLSTPPTATPRSQYNEHQVSPPPNTRAFLNRTLDLDGTEIRYAPQQTSITIELQDAKGFTSKFRYESAEGQGFAHTYINDGDIVVSEVRSFVFDNMTNQLRDQRGVGGRVPLERVDQILADLASFATISSITNSLHVNHRTPTQRAASPRPATAASPRAASPRRQYKPISPMWQNFRSWLQGDDDDIWDLIHFDLEADNGRLSVVDSTEPYRNAVSKTVYTRGVHSWDIKIASGSKGFSFGVIKDKVDNVNRNLTKSDNAWVYASCGEIAKCGFEIIGAEKYREGDLISCHLNLDKGTIGWSRNGTRQRGYFSAIEGPVRLVVGMTEMSSSVELVIQGRQQEKKFFKNFDDFASASTPRRGERPETPKHAFGRTVSSVHSLGTPDTVERSGKKKNGNKAIKTTSLKCGAGTIMGPVDLYIPSGAVAQVEFDDPSALSPSDSPAGLPIVVKVSRIKPAWTPAHPQCSDTVEPSRQLSPRIRDVARNGLITL
eukprot:TRINITY_DN18373_c0_g2_i2.p1 TRINITY_DN18373_c0_g2~~TRINITY_DN18373_c0_g2_i2.p1  ORF type:complete len:760 (+),score=117.84 TRINITY_DN18373_c0_g2_i2:27-2282(+)